MDLKGSPPVKFCNFVFTGFCFNFVAGVNILPFLQIIIREKLLEQGQIGQSNCRRKACARTQSFEAKAKHVTTKEKGNTALLLTAAASPAVKMVHEEF